jgi:hypothetical protein
MILLTHAVTGAAVGQLSGNPALGFITGFISHFLLDALPHWDYPFSEAVRDGQLPRRDLLKIAADGVLGLLGVVTAQFFFPGLLFWPMLAGAIGAMVPDALQFAYFKTRWRWFGYLQGFHEWIHTSVRLVGEKKLVIIGVVSQLILVAVSYWFISLLA